MIPAAIEKPIQPKKMVSEIMPIILFSFRCLLCFNYTVSIGIVKSNLERISNYFPNRYSSSSRINSTSSTIRVTNLILLSFVLCSVLRYVSIIHRSAGLSIPFSIKSESFLEINFNRRKCLYINNLRQKAAPSFVVSPFVAYTYVDNLENRHPTSFILWIFSGFTPRKTSGGLLAIRTHSLRCLTQSI